MIFLEDADLDFSDPPQSDNYFPLSKSTYSVFYQNIDYSHPEIINVVELMYGIDEIEIDDSIL